MAKGCRWDIGALIAAALIAYAIGCSGPQPLRTAIRPADEERYARALQLRPDSSKDSFYLFEAERRGQTPELVAAGDARLSTTRNPFQANRDPEAVSRGAVIYKTHCITCHGEHSDGRGPAMPRQLPLMNFHSFGKRFAVTLHGGAPRAWFRKINEGFTSQVMNTDGSRNSMPAFKDTLAREQIWLAITYLQSLDATASTSLSAECHDRQ